MEEEKKKLSLALTPEQVREVLRQLAGDAGMECPGPSDMRSYGPDAETWSAPEKAIVRRLVQPSPELPYPLVDLKLGNGQVEKVYDIPQDRLPEVVRLLWPFDTDPDAVLYDMHEDSEIEVQHLKVLRWEDRNVIVSPWYAKSGGMVVDICTSEEFERCRNDAVRLLEERVRRGQRP